jgi:telomere length regulation protein
MMLDYLSEKFLDRLNLDGVTSDSTVSAVAGIIRTATVGDESKTNELIRWCTAASGAGLGRRTGIRRAVLAFLAQDREAITAVLEKSLAQFGDELYIKHAAVLQQNGTSLPKYYTNLPATDRRTSTH